MRYLLQKSIPLQLVLTYMLLVGILCAPLFAADVVTLGVVVNGNGLKDSREMAENVGRLLEERLAVPVRVRSFADETHLYSWLLRFREVDIAWFSKEFYESLPSGQVKRLTGQDGAAAMPVGEVVLRRDIDPVLLQQLTRAFEEMPAEAVAGPQSAPAPVVETVTPPMPADAQSTAAVPTPSEDSLATPVVESSVANKPGVAGAEDLGALVPSAKLSQDPVLSPAKVKQDQSISLVADSLSYNSEDDSYEARGDVVLRQAEVELTSDELLWQAATQDAAAQGGVTLKDADTEVAGESLQYNLATGQGQVRNGQVFVHEGNFHLAGEEVEKRGQADYFVKEGMFTTCDGEIPDWKFSASEVDVTLGGYARAKNVWFHIRDIPVLYTPYLLFPVKTERESGLLAPWFGYSNNKGTRASLAWYQVIDRNLDATFYLDYLSEIGLGKGIEYRYALANQNNGEARYYHVTGYNETPDLYYLEWKHHGELPAQWKLTADVEYADDKLFFEEFGEAAEEYNRDTMVSTVMLRRNWQKLNLVGYARYIKDLDAKNNDQTLQRLPEVGLGLTRYRLGDTSFYAGLESYATRFWRREGNDGDRLFLRPSLSAVYRPGGWLEVVPEVALYERLYNADGDYDEDKFVPEASLTLASRLVRAYDSHWFGSERVQHSIEPKIVYTYVPDELQENLPLFDVFDRIAARNEIFYSVINRFTARSTAADGTRMYRELLNVRLSQSYDIDEVRHNTSGKDQPFSDVRLELDLKPNNYLTFDADGLVPVYGSAGLNRLSAGATVKDVSGNALKLTYVYKDEEWAGSSTDYGQLKAYTPMLKPLYLKFEERYDFDAGHELEKVVGLEYRSKCWSLQLVYRNRYREDAEDDHEIGVAFVLAGLGESGGFGTGEKFDGSEW